MPIDSEYMKLHLPHYLATENRDTLIKNLESIRDGRSANYLIGTHRDPFMEEMLQGDGWRGFQKFNFYTGEICSIRGLVISNSCDIDPNNPRALPTQITFAPLVKLSQYEEILRRSWTDTLRIQNRLDSIRDQKTTNIFFLPEGGQLSEDYIINFDDISSMPASLHMESKEREKLFTLSDTGFYLLVFKLSVHFCRLQENINRSDVSQD